LEVLGRSAGKAYQSKPCAVYLGHGEGQFETGSCVSELSVCNKSLDRETSWRSKKMMKAQAPEVVGRMAEKREREQGSVQTFKGRAMRATRDYRSFPDVHC
jgi:hypothetical protein